MRVCPNCGSNFDPSILFCPTDGAALLMEGAAAGDPLVHTVVDGRYRIESELGHGGMGTIYLAHHVMLKKSVALKVLSGADKPAAIQRFVQEAQTVSSLGHPNIVVVHDFGHLKDGRAYFAMEFLDGLQLSKRMAHGPLPVRLAIHITKQIISALAAVHEEGIVHRDLKPDNVHLIERDGDRDFVKLLDFGVAKVGSAPSKLTRPGVVFGTPEYMSPEQVSGQHVDQRTDIYALGVILYEMVTGDTPFHRDDPVETMKAHLYDAPPPPPKELNLGDLEAVLKCALEKDPENRYISMETFGKALDQVAGTLGEASSTNSDEWRSMKASPEAYFGRDKETQQLRSDAVKLPTSRGPLIGLVFILLTTCLVSGFFLKSKMSDEQVATTLGEAETAQTNDATSSSTDSTLRVRPTPEELSGQRTLTIVSDPVGAMVFRNEDGENILLGESPVPVVVGGDETVVLELRLDGRRITQIEVDSLSPSTVEVTLGVLDSSSRVVATRMTEEATPGAADEAEEGRAATRMRRTRRRVVGDVAVVDELVDPFAMMSR